MSLLVKAYTDAEVDARIAAALYTEGARVYHSAHQTIPNASSAYLAFDSERYDTDNIHDPTNNSRLTCRTAGKYLITACVEFFGNATGYRVLLFRVNRVYPIAETIHSIVSADVVVLNTTTIYDLSVGDYVEAQVYQNSGGDLDVRVDIRISPTFMMQRIG